MLIIITNLGWHDFFLLLLLCAGINEWHVQELLAQGRREQPEGAEVNGILSVPKR